MAYKALARKWRPKNLSQVVGQAPICQALHNALEKQWLHHAYLFTGTRGVGKTSIARILAKCLNCETGITAIPCDVCSTCVEINQGRCVDVLEIDAASRTKIEDTRELLDNTQYAPVQARFKIYLIDEVHMLSRHSFNALLKTLEEPPEHVKFILATTDPKKLPVTILSRCLQFYLKPLIAQDIVQQLQAILDAEGLSAELSSLEIIAKAAAGSMRDALSLLDQAIAYSDGHLQQQQIMTMLGIVDNTIVYQLLQALAEKSITKLLTISASIAKQGGDYFWLLQELINHLQQIALLQVNALSVDNMATELTTIAKQCEAEEIQLYYQIALTGLRDLPLAPDPAKGFDMLLLRMYTFKPVTMANNTSSAESVPVTTVKSSVSAYLSKTNQKVIHTPPIMATNNREQKILEQNEKAAIKPSATDIKKDQKTEQQSSYQYTPNDALSKLRRLEEKATSTSKKKQQKTLNIPDKTNKITDEQQKWNLWVNQLSLSGLVLQILKQSILLEKNTSQITLGVEHNILRICSHRIKKQLERCLQAQYGETIKIELKALSSEDMPLQTPEKWQAEQDLEVFNVARGIIENNPLVHTLIEKFAASIQEKSIAKWKDNSKQDN